MERKVDVSRDEGVIVRGARPPATTNLVEAAGQPIGGGLIKPGYDTRLTNEDLAPLRIQSWGSYNIFAFWMSDVHSVGGYVTAGSLFALGLGSWQVLVALLIGIGIVNVFCNPVAKPSQQIGVPYPVICRSVFGVLGRERADLRHRHRRHSTSWPTSSHRPSTSPT
ncbi:MAG TPA: cytosine permease [Pseudonocardiaceae bacterium]